MDRFCGRKTELGKLGRMFDRVQKGDAGAVLVSGPAGSGKTALVTRFAVEAERLGALFVYGKADAALRSTPFATVVAAMEMLIKKAIAEDPGGCEGLQQALRRHHNSDIDDDLAPLLSLVPALSYLFKHPRPQAIRPGRPNAPSANPRLLSLVETFATALNRPLVIFLDDLQWMDTASYGFLRYLAIGGSPAGLLLVMALRSEAAEDGPELKETTRLYKSLETTLSLPLAGLNKRDARLLVARLMASGQDLTPLADLCLQKTAGNPLYLTRLLNDLLDSGVVFREGGEWAYDIGRVSELGITENVADLIVPRIAKLDKACLALLKQAACIQGEISVGHLMATSGFPKEKIETLLWKPSQQDLLLRTEKGYAFAHDKIVEAVEALLDDDEAHEIHDRLANFFLAAARRGDPEANLFTLLYHYGFCRSSVTDPTYKREMAGIYFRAGEKALVQSAYDLALDYFIQGKAHYPGDIWSEDERLALDYCRRIARCAYLSGDFDTADRMFAEVDTRAGAYCDRLPTELMKIACYQASQKETQALTTGLDVLRRLGFGISEKPSRPAILMAILKAWGRYLLSRKARLKRRRLDPDSDACKAVHCLSALGAIAYYHSPDRLLPMVTARAFDLSVKHGNMEETPVCYITFGMVLNEITGGIQWGRRLGAMAGEISRDFSDHRRKVRERTLCNVFLEHWDKSLDQSIRDFEAAETLCLRQGDHEYFGYNALGVLHCMLISGRHLPVVWQWIAEKKKMFRRINNRFALTTAGFMQQAVDNLILGVPRPWVLDGDHFEEARLEDGNSGPATEFHLYKFCAAFYCGRTDKAAEIREILVTCDEMAIDAYPYYYYQFLCALLDIGLRKKNKKIRRHLKKLKTYAARNEAVYGNKYLLALGKRLRIKGDAKAADVYRDAAAAAQRHGFRFEQALAWEGLGKCAADGGDDAAAREHFAQAIRLYRGWGLKWKQGLFDDDMGDGLAPEVPGSASQAAASDSSERGTCNQSRDPAGENCIETILETLQRITGASAIHAAARTTQQWKSCIYINARGIHRPATFMTLPDKILNFACATDEVIRMDAQSTVSPCFDTAYFWKKRPSSLMVVPVGGNKGVYFENAVRSPREMDLIPMARRLFDGLDLPDAVKPLASGAQRPDAVVHQRNCDRIRACMTDQEAFKNPKLTLAGFARQVKLPQRAVTDAINTCLEQNFRTFVNCYRVEAVKQAMNDPANRDKTILEIALTQGFNSKSTFNDVFKQIVGTTPSAFMTAHAMQNDTDRKQAS